jgi:hypothetical protein
VEKPKNGIKTTMTLQLNREFTFSETFLFFDEKTSSGWPNYFKKKEMKKYQSPDGKMILNLKFLKIDILTN